ncbi:hypothetical protein B7G68_04655 [Caulobacter segnis]|uniref:Uncharacterized protein n=2 Tax=Caulobacter segnis TaxID=88688 RepID=D5VEZ5_CAUST|nr:hypothetical protein [Caulobacter segnis]ADG09413.1 hypothetical protein Cseg_0907 [Caulobacter segnis ATCC 21756]AVQ01212.1 hypothetical protein B7G68_04655 [Caulobacter segnis]
MLRRFALLAPAVGLILSPTAALAERAESVTTARAAVRAQCPLSSATATEMERSDKSRETLGLALAMVGANIAGSLASSGMTALGNAIEKASVEKGFVAEGATTFRFYDLSHPAEGERLARLEQPRSCLILFLPADADGAKQSKGKAPSPKSLKEVGALQRLNAKAPDAGLELRPFLDDAAADATTNTLKDLGAGVDPRLYVEAELIPTDEGMMVRPVLAWYGAAWKKGAPSKAAPTELHVTFATPAAGSDALDIGAPFASVQIPLPSLAPDNAVGSWDLAGRKFIALPQRPIAGAPEKALADTNALYASVATLEAEKKTATRVAEEAQRKALATKKPDDKEAQRLAELALSDKVKELDEASNRLKALKEADAQTVRTFGVTNVKARFVVIRDANGFGLAVAAALKGQSENVGKAVQEAVAPQPKWSTADTTMVSAMTAVAAKQRELSAAQEKGDATAAAALADELTILKAKANEAAVALGDRPPYPNLLPVT